MTDKNEKVQEVYRIKAGSLWHEAENVYAVNQSEDERFIDLHMIYPFNGISAEFYKEDGFDLMEKTQTVHDLVIAVYEGLDWIYRNGEPLYFKEIYEESVRKNRDKKNRSTVEKLYRKRLGFWMLRHFKPQLISVNLRRQVDQLLRNLLRDGKFEYRTQYPESFLKNFMLFGKMEDIDLDIFAENMRYNAFLDLPEETKMNLYIAMKAGGTTGYDEYLQEWWEERNDNETN